MLKLCDDIDTLSMMLCDGELAAQELRDVELHLMDCPACRTLVERDRGFLDDLRQQLAPPPAPALLRARLGRALDQADRARRPSWRTLVLPASAALAAAAALLVFATSGATTPRRHAPTTRTAVGPVIEHQVGAPHAYSPDVLVLNDLTIEFTGTERIGQDVATLNYWLVTPENARIPLYATVHDAARLDADPSTRILVGGYDVWAIQGGLVVRDGPRAIRLSSPLLNLNDLKAIIGGTPLIARIGADDPRR
ncbi:MAG: zf-HC2 domain-containing protein [Myxococcales bacterium]|nr:zf-HC2 domain-containing protein [Myxococcales bacterium]